MPEPGWVAATERFIEAANRLGGAPRAGVFQPPGAADLLHPRLSELGALLRVMLGGGAKPEQGLLIARAVYDALGGHPDGPDPETAVLRRLGRRRIAMLGCGTRIAV